MAIKLHLNTGDKVRNIRTTSSRYGLIGFVEKIQLDAKRGNKYLVKWSTGVYGTYFVELAHHSLEAVVGSKSARQHYKLATFGLRYGKPLLSEEELDKAWADLHKMCVDNNVMVVHDELVITPKLRTLKKVRRNVITGKTQEEMVKICGSHAIGVHQFNKRCLGLSTGQAMRLIGEAIVNPGSPVRLWDVDHAITDPHVKAGRGDLNKTFVALVESLIKRNELVGITFDLPKQYMTFNPIVIEETYVETH
ncbi:hypothetical protein phD2B_0012 [Lelliottia phage phD2B]|uniref:Uncharacterized protein n=1 Tax=Lelliottia phage phD2B TaxID=1542498 RepID=A0A088FWW8_9CAUD|nr:hypothetical protein phD2B_0012 [Lelliottia phage phD2B]AIM51239.1 hypothetical protein phD2B_0012 [Lelliottia phage phD2B]